MHLFKKTITLLLVLIINPIIAQDFSKDWVGHFSYLDIKDISQGNNKVFGAAENAIFIYDTQTEETEKLSTINGLSGETISSIKYVEEQGVLLIGFENGLIQVYTESSQDILSVVDILDKATIPPNTKKINHFNIFNNTAYISTDFGISLYDIESLEFEDTYFIGMGGIQLQINQTTIFNDFIYSASSSGIQRAEINNPNLIDYQEWELVSGGNWNAIETFDNKIYATRTNGGIYEFDNASAPNLLITYNSTPLDLRSENNHLIVTTQNEIFAYTQNFTELINLSSINYNETQFVSGSISKDNNSIYAGTRGVYNASIGKAGLGILKININDPSSFKEIHPDGPLLNRFFQVNTQAGNVWGVHGGHSITFNVFQGIRRSGISHLQNGSWQNIPYSVIEETITDPWALSYIAPNPFNQNQVFISSGFSGLIEILNNEAVQLYNQDNSSIAPNTGSNAHVALASHYDQEGALWVTSRSVRALNRFKDNQWESFDLAQIIPNPVTNFGFFDLASDDEGNIFIGSSNFGLIGFKENNGNPILQNINGVAENLPSTVVTAVEVDKRNQVWIGTISGLRVIFNTDSFFANSNFNASEIIVLDEGNEASELLFQQFVTDIEVDGANNKWIGTLDSGLFYFSPDGQETILRFTKDNSPLPSDRILDISIDDNNGLVYIATEKGVVAYNSQSSGPQDNFDEAFIFPNPVRPSFDIVGEKIKIRDITENVNIKITDIEGNLVAEAESNTNSRFKGFNLEIDGGTALWNGKNLANQIVASGVYLVMLSNLDSLETKVLKVMVVR